MYEWYFDEAELSGVFLRVQSAEEQEDEELNIIFMVYGSTQK